MKNTTTDIKNKSIKGTREAFAKLISRQGHNSPKEFMNKTEAFEYIVLFLCQESIMKERELKPEYSWSDFNTRNNFGIEKLSLISFFVCVANGKESRETLFGLFDKFYSEKAGVVEQDIYNYISKNTSNIFTYNSNDLSLKAPELLNSLDACNSRQRVIECICMHFSIDISNLKVEDYKLLVAIEKSLINLKNQTQEFFSKFSKDVLSKHSKEHNIWILNSYKYSGRHSNTAWTPFDQDNFLDVEILKEVPSIFAVEEYKLLS